MEEAAAQAVGTCPQHHVPPLTAKAGTGHAPGSGDRPLSEYLLWRRQLVLLCQHLLSGVLVCLGVLAE